MQRAKNCSQRHVVWKLQSSFQTCEIFANKYITIRKILNPNEWIFWTQNNTNTTFSAVLRLHRVVFTRIWRIKLTMRNFKNTLRINPKLKIWKEYNFVSWKFLNTYKIRLFSTWKHEPKDNKNNTSVMFDANIITFLQEVICVIWGFDACNVVPKSLLIL